MNKCEILMVKDLNHNDQIDCGSDPVDQIR